MNVYFHCVNLLQCTMTHSTFTIHLPNLWWCWPIPWNVSPLPYGYWFSNDISRCRFVCFITKSFLTYSFVLPTPTLSTICRPLSSYMCSITPETVNVGSSYSHMRGTGVGCWLSDCSNCSHWSFEAAVLPINPNIYTDQWEPIVIYHSITLTGRYTTMQPTLLTSWLQLLSYKV